MTLPEVLQQAGGIVGVLGAGIAGEIYRRFRAAEKTARAAHKFARMAHDTTENIASQVGAIKSGMHLDITSFKNSLEDRMRRFEERYDDAVERQSEPSLITAQIRALPADTAPMFEQMNTRMKEIRDDLMSEIIRERGQRHALQKELNAYAQGEQQSWSELMRLIGQLEAKIEALMILQKTLHELQRDMQVLKMHKS